jgi:hypothetical protein
MPATLPDGWAAEIEALVRRVVREELGARSQGERREVLSMRAASRILGIDRGSTLPDLIAEGRIGTVEIRGRICVRRADVERILATGAPTPATPARRRPGAIGSAAALRAVKLDEL